MDDLGRPRSAPAADRRSMAPEGHPNPGLPTADGTLVVGWREWVVLPALGIERIKAKLDTGARTSALHAFGLHAWWQDDRPWVEFAVHPLQRNDAVEHFCRAPVLDRRWVVSSSGHRERRYVIATNLRLGTHEWSIEVTLTNRDEMGFRMLIGRTAMERRLIVDPAASYRVGKAKRRRRVASKATKGKTAP